MIESEQVKRKSADVMSDIERTISTIDGISTADAFKLGQLVREYGTVVAGETMGPLMTSLLGSFDKKPKKPWEEG